MALNIPAIIKEVGRGAHGARDLPVADAQALYAAMLAGEVPELELGALLIAYRIKGESLGELQGFMQALGAHTLAFDAPAGPLPVLLPSYNGARKLPNLTPLVALLLAREGVPVLMHGPLQSHGRVTSAAVLAELGVPVCENPAAITRAPGASRMCRSPSSHPRPHPPRRPERQGRSPILSIAMKMFVAEPI